MPKTVLITGANGFLARALHPLLADWRLHALVRPGSRPPGDWDGVHDHVEAASAAADYDAVLHLAACIPADMRVRDPELLRTNVMLPAALVLAHPRARHVLASSVSVYGVPTALPLTVTSPTAANTPYGLSKLAAESVVAQAASHAVLRLSSLVGPGMRERTFVPSLLRAARGGTLTVFGDGTRLQDYIDVRDAAEQCRQALLRDDSFTTLAVSGEARSNAQVAADVAALTGAQVRFDGVDASPSYCYSYDGAIRLAPSRHALPETLREMLQG